MKARVCQLALSVALLAGCSSSPAALPTDIGEWKFEEGTARLTVPALWAGTRDDGTPVGGVEPAQIEVSTAGATPEYRVDLADIRAEGAGPAWQAATGMAAAFATVYVGADPATVDLTFTVTGPIDGPSAGGILTVGLIAAFRGESLDPTATMTGTITADGSIGAVGGVPTKLEAAAREGFTTVVLPAAVTDVDRRNENTLAELADELNLTVVPVRTVGEAYAAMTGTPYDVPNVDVVDEYGPRTQQAVEAITRTNVVDLDAALMGASESVDPAIVEWATQTLARARSQFESRDYSASYGNTALALIELARATARSEALTVAQDRGLEAARDLTLDRAQQALAASSAAMTTGARKRVAGESQCFSLPTALGWAAFTQASMDAVVDQLADATAESEIADLAELVAEGVIGIDRFLPQSLVVVESLNEGSGTDCSKVTQHLSDYSRFLVQGAKANETYLQDVIGVRLDDPRASQMLEYVAGGVSARDLSLDVTQELDPYPLEAEQFSTALTYFWLTSYAVAAIQVYDLGVAGQVDDFSADSSEYMDVAIQRTWSFVDTRSDLIRAQALDPSSATWSANWALSAALENAQGRFATQAGWLAQGELWYDAVQTMVMLSYLDPTTVPSPETMDQD